MSGFSSYKNKPASEKITLAIDAPSTSWTIERLGGV